MTLTVGSSLFLAKETDKQLFDVQNSPPNGITTIERVIDIQGINRADVFARYQLYRDDAHAVAIQPLLTLPSAYEGRLPAEVVEDEGALELAVLGGRNVRLLGNNHFIDGKIAYRQRFAAPRSVYHRRPGWV